MNNQLSSPQLSPFLDPPSYQDIVANNFISSKNIKRILLTLVMFCVIMFVVIAVLLLVGVLFSSEHSEISDMDLRPFKESFKNFFVGNDAIERRKKDQLKKFFNSLDQDSDGILNLADLEAINYDKDEFKGIHFEEFYKIMLDQAIEIDANRANIQQEIKQEKISTKSKKQKILKKAQNYFSGRPVGMGFDEFKNYNMLERSPRKNINELHVHNILKMIFICSDKDADGALSLLEFQAGVLFVLG